MLEAFDAQVPNAPCERRRTSVTALQALSMYDSDFVNAEAKHLAERVRKEAGPEPQGQVERVFAITVGRPPSDTERKNVSAFFSSLARDEDGLAGLCRVMLNSNEFLYVD